MTKVKDLTNSDEFIINFHDRSQTEARNQISDLLDHYNVAKTGISDNEPLDITVVDKTTNEVVGGLVGRTSMGVFFINYFYLPDSLRGKGYGTRMLLQAEQLAALRGCRVALLFTMEIQAPTFYVKNGYEIFGRVECTPEGNARLFMRKPIQPVG
ncbi:GNAT family N-acetyltransferase [Pseudomonas syringae]|uniref:GNAT family N-acetyltransferase n=1 Tax=Pseudomonas syringae TaxID=317 RepID=UPI001F38DEFC|nr:GNAT family N-acetyltransferase [Pseudomonas syringae]MCF9002364.1 GNAT family N-acetyltransferase [Pseudomonas syringae]MDA3136845.1 GNAT family N-acetyltransferase [Pseudomonas syringae]